MVTSVIGGLTNSFFKAVFKRVRPPVYDIPHAFNFKNITDKLDGDYSMPSGHASVAAAAFFTLAITEKNKFLKIIYCILPFITAYARVYFTKHWTSDVSLSILLGFIFLLSGSLLIVVIIHVLIDLISGMMGVLGQAEQPSDEI